MSRSQLSQAGRLCHACLCVPRGSVEARFRFSPPAAAILSPFQQPLRRGSAAARWASAVAEAPTPRRARGRQSGAMAQDVAPSSPPPLADAQQLARMVEDSRNKFLSVDGIPAQDLTTAALQACLGAAMALHPQLRQAEAQSKASASKLVRLGLERTGGRLPIDVKLEDAVERISHAAYAIISHANVEMTPELLELYVQIQAQLGRPESLPTVLEMYAHKPKPVLREGEIRYLAAKPNRAARAVEEGVADMALQTAIQAKHLDSALGIIEASYAMPAFRRQKLLRYGTAPAIGLATLPFGILGLASAYAAYWQNTMDLTTATHFAFAGISGYFICVGSLGVIAKLSHKDQMKRVTWTPGTPLRYRWLREEERAALDKVACAWGFKEAWRWGEESGPEWEGLKDHMGYKQMLLDRAEFLDGMG